MTTPKPVETEVAPATRFKPYKFLVMPVVQEVDADGTVINEVQPEQPTAVFGVEGLRTFADGFVESLATARTAEANGRPGGQ